MADAGLLAASLAFAASLLQGLLPLWGAQRGRPAWMTAAGGLAAAQFAMAAIAFAALATLFLQNDFSVAYVATNSNTLLPTIYKFAAVWGGHEGSLLLWMLMLAGWSAAAAAWTRGMADAMRARVIGVLGLVSAGFWAFLLFSSNPFLRRIPAPAEGRDLNPLLQDPGLAAHPPMLYMGYVGFSVAFAFAVAALLSGGIDSAWARRARPWTLAAWSFLTMGIMLGSWWAYYELGWGGWWFWDPVENASFMPWLAGTALLHSLAVSEARGIFKSWTALLAILTFSLCLLGTFLVRSGVLVSVHAFASSPDRGAFILALWVAVTGGALALYAARAGALSGGGGFSAISRESGILLNNIFLTAAAFCVLLGTLYPLILDALGLGKISVGPPYFNFVFAPLAAVPAGLAVFGSLSRWKRDAASRLAAKLWPALALSLAAAALLPLAADEYRVSAVPGLWLASWALLGALAAAWNRRGTRPGAGFWGMIAAHAGVGIFVAGVTAVGAYEIEKDVRLAAGEEASAGGYVFRLEEFYETQGANYAGVGARMLVLSDGERQAVLEPEKRRYFSSPDNAMTEAGIAARWNGDLYASLGEPLGDGAWSLRLQVKPFVRLIWGGALLMALGGALAAAARRRL